MASNKRPIEINRLSHVFLALCLLPLLWVTINSQEEDLGFDPNDPWFNKEVLPEVDLDGLVANLSAKISWFKYVGNLTLECAADARRQETIMLAIEVLHDCLQASYHECASEWGNEPENAECTATALKPCGTVRLGAPTTAEKLGPHLYKNSLDCVWKVEIPDGHQFVMNMSVDEFHMEYVKDCVYDHMMIYDGHSLTDKSYGRFCGSIVPFIVYGNSTKMMVTAHTDNFIGKYGFRIVYQVMDIGFGSTMKLESEEMDKLTPLPPDGTMEEFGLETATPLSFETILTGAQVYTYKWHIKQEFGTLIFLTVRTELTYNNSLAVFDGPLEQNYRLIYAEFDKEKGEPINEVFTDSVATTSFQASIRLYRTYLDDNTTFTASYRTEKSPPTSQMHDDLCSGESSKLELNDDSVMVIGVGEDTQLDHGKPIQCFWNIHTKNTDRFIELQFRKLEFNGPNIKDCQYEGLYIIMGTGLASNETVLGPWCHNEPIGLFRDLESGINNITADGQNVFVAYYSFIPYEAFPWKRGQFHAEVRTTHCVGVINPCSTPTYKPAAPPYFTVVESNKDDENSRNLTYNCHEDRCCIIQQYPTYSPISSFRCEVHLRKLGPKLTTSTLTTQLVVPDKGDQSMYYSCQKKEMGLLEKGPHRRHCNGTETHVAYNANTLVALGAFFMRIQIADCGYYHPDIHPDNRFETPCAKAEFPFESKPYSVEFLDKSYNNSTSNSMQQYFIEVDYTYTRRRKDCNNRLCSIDRLEIWPGSKASPQGNPYVWTKLPVPPFRWYSWGNTLESKDWWKSTVVVKRNAKDDCTVEDKENICQLVVNFTGPHEVIFPDNDDLSVVCPDGFEVVGSQCLTIVLPKKKPKARLLVMEGFSNTQAEEACNNKSGSMLASFDNQKDWDAFKVKLFKDWWKRKFRKIAGPFLVHIGLRDVGDMMRRNLYRWSDGHRMVYSDWRYPELNVNINPDLGVANGEDIDFIRSSAVKYSMDRIQPTFSDDLRCTMYLGYNLKWQNRWIKIPCDDVIEGSAAVCEIAPVDKVEKQSLMGQIPDDFKVEIEKKGKLDVLRLGKYRCPAGYMLVGEQCWRYMKETVYIKNDMMKTCDTDGTTPVINDDNYEMLLEALDIWLGMRDKARVRLRWGSSYNDSTFCQGVVADYWIKDSMIMNETWTLVDLKGAGCPASDNQTQTEDVKSMEHYICEKDPLPYSQECLPHQRSCPDGSCILEHHFCDGYKDCLDGSDEICDHICNSTTDPTLEFDCTTNCPMENCTCDPLFFQCPKAGCIPLSKMCDLKKDCPDGEDEDLCSHIVEECPVGDNFRCGDGRCIKNKVRCDYRQDCADNSDEENCMFNVTCPVKTNMKSGLMKRCSTDGYCLPKVWTSDNFPDCEGDPPENEPQYETLVKSQIKAPNGELMYTPLEHVCNKGFIHCNNELVSCVRLSRLCMYDIGPLENFIGCRGGEHLARCENFQCPNKFKCPKSYCIALERVCDGRSDCQNGEDEQQCENFACPGMFKCRGEGKCIQQEKICDGFQDCVLSGDDEALCEYKEKQGCPPGCRCHGRTLDCSRNMWEEVPTKTEVDVGIRSLILTKNMLKDVPPDLKAYTYLYRLDLSHNKMTLLPQEAFITLTILHELYLHDNELDDIEGYTFAGLSNLVKLTLTNNKLTSLKENAFKSLVKIKHLDLSGQSISALREYYFSGLYNLITLNVSHNKLTVISNVSFSHRENGKYSKFEHLESVDISKNFLEEVSSWALGELPKKTRLYTDRFKFCCFAKQVAYCVPPPDEFSSCEHLIANRWLSLVLWGLGIAAFAGNIIIFQQRVKHERETTPSILLQHLAFADMMMGGYLLIIAGGDEYHKGDYINNADEWQAHALCKLASFCYIVSNEMAVIVLMMMTLDRLLATVPYFNSRGLSLRNIRAFVALAWAACIIASIIPILGLDYFHQSESQRNGACLMYNIAKGGSNSWEYWMIMVLIFNLILYICMAAGYVMVQQAINKEVDIWSWTLPDDLTEEEKDAEVTFRKNEVIITRRLMLVIFTNFTIWFPVIFIGILAMGGVAVDRSFSAWVALTIVPLNAVINPYLYTFTVKPYRLRVDDLLLNWVEESDIEDSDEEDDEDEDGKGETTLGDNSTAQTGTSDSKEATSKSA